MDARNQITAWLTNQCSEAHNLISRVACSNSVTMEIRLKQDPENGLDLLHYISYSYRSGLLGGNYSM